MKKLSLAFLAVGVGASASLAEVKVSDNLALSGFVDMSVSGMQPDGGDATLAASFDQFELDFMYKFGEKVSARVDVNKYKYDSLGFEQGFITLGMGNLSVTTGRFLSVSGFEAAEPTGLFQYSNSKNLGGTTPGYGGYQNGLALAYNGGMFGAYGAIVANPWSAADTDLLLPGFEAQVSLMPMEPVTVKAAFVMDMAEDTLGESMSQSYFNVWGQYAAGPITAAAEFNYWMTYAETNDMGWLAMVNYKLAENIAATVRYSGVIVNEGDPDTEITLSPSLSVLPNWLVLAEGRYDIEDKAVSYAAESTISF